MVFSRNPPLMQQDDSTPAELAPILAYINTHTNKVYHEGYFLKLNDLDSRKC
jgi:CCR4-NOT transcriptional complex subunit CAF120